jgi:aminomethyltransferase
MSPGLAKTPLHAEHVKLGARMVPFAGWEMPVQYRGIAAEHQAVRTAAGLFDVSHMGEVVFAGPSAGAVLNGLVVGDVLKLPVGRALYTCACNQMGGILDDLIVYRLGADRYLVVCNASNREKIVAHFAPFGETGCDISDQSEDYGLLALQGPRAFEILARAGTTVDVAKQVPPFHVAELGVAGVSVKVARTGYTGEDGVELLCPSDCAAELWRRLLDVGSSHGIEPVGLGARDTLRLEARLSLYGNELDEAIHPFEAGIGWIVDLTKPDFIGKAALVAAKSAPPKRKLVGFEMTGRGIARHGYPIVDASGRTIGVCTSGAPSPTLGKSIGLGFVPPELSSVGSNLLVDCRGKAVGAVVVRTPFYKRSAG